MNINIINSEDDRVIRDSIVLLCCEDDKSNCCFDYLNKEIKDLLSITYKSEAFSGKLNDLKSLGLCIEEKLVNVIFVGLGKEQELTVERIRRAITKGIKEANKLNTSSLEIYGLSNINGIFAGDIIKGASEAAILANYKFNKYKSDSKETFIKDLDIVWNKKSEMEAALKASIEGTIVADAAILARGLVNEPANILGPSELAKEAQTAGNKNGFDVRIYDENEIKELGMKAFMEVAKGSEKPPRLIVMKYAGNKEDKENVIGLVGKGLMYDSGGLSIKSNEGMLTMKADMSGAAAVIGAMTAISSMKLKANVVGVIAACENMISGGCYRPGDIIGSMSGKTIEILSADAEGRLTLADAITYIIEKEGASKVVDIATLTGAAVAALGKLVSAVVTNSEELYSELEVASKSCDERIWRLPDFEEYGEANKSEVADLKNLGGKFAGAVTAGLFVGCFVQDKPWLHIDIAGPAFLDEEHHYMPKGATGYGVRLLYNLVKNLSEN